MAYYIGLMSGTSMDAVDAALVSFTQDGVKLTASHSHPIPADIHAPLNELVQHGQFDIHRYGELDIKLGQLFAEAANTLLEQNQISHTEIAAIGSHGQTVFHAANHRTPFTLQIGDPNVIAEHTNITTVADFRRRDIAAGGQGAPLVPAFHNKVFRSPHTNRIILNIGGIANITVLPADQNQPVFGFDTGPGNTLMDMWAQKHLNAPYDKHGQWASEGNINSALLQQCLSDNYFALPPPKSTGRELFNLPWLNKQVCEDSAENIQATLCELTIESIALAIEQYTANRDELYICGGGARNRYLMNRLKTRLENIKIATTDTLGIDPDWVEAAAFAWLAQQTLAQLPGNLPEATGASHPVVLGGIYPTNKNAGANS